MTIETSELLSLVIPLRVVEPHNGQERRLPRWWGRAAHALALRVIGTQDTALEKRLHAGSDPRPFTASSLLGLPAQAALDPDQVVALRITGLQEPVSQALRQAADIDGSLAAGKEVELDGIAFRVDADPVPESFESWRENSSYGILGGRYLLSAASPPDTLSLHFASPVSFKYRGKQMPLPLPDLVFGSLLARWNAFAPNHFSEELRGYVADEVAITRYDLHSRSLPGKQGSFHLGGLGRVTYTCLRYDRYWVSILHTLADFARFSGVGAGTTNGMGQCQNLNN